MNIRILDKQELDFKKVVDIFYEVQFLKYPEKRDIYKAAIEKAFLNSQLVVSVWDNDKLIGFARVVTDQSLFATIWNMIVKPKYQNKGIGSLLIKKCLDTYPNLHFFLFAGEQSADFYKKMGFDVHRFGMYLKDGFKQCVIYT